MAQWESEHFSHVGFTYGTLEKAGVQQHTPETCWAAAMASASILLKKENWDNQTTWYQIARRSQLLEERTTRIQPPAFYKLLRGLPSFSVQACSSILEIAAAIGPSLSADKVMLLFSAQHVVLLGQMQMEKGANGVSQYHVIDPAEGRVRTWPQEKLNEFNPVDGMVVS